MTIDTHRKTFRSYLSHLRIATQWLIDTKLYAIKYNQKRVINNYNDEQRRIKNKWTKI